MQTIKPLLPLIIATLLGATLTLVAETDDNPGKHLFILSGQSNMAKLDPKLSFIPAVEKEFGQENVIVVKDAQGGRPIRDWYKNWKPTDGPVAEGNGQLYDALMGKVRTATKGQKIASITFIWMQGEQDAKENGNVYEASLRGVIAQLEGDLGTQEMNFVIGRLSDSGLEGKRFPDWMMIREIQVKVAESSPRGAWVDTDDLNDWTNEKGVEIKNGLHYSAEGYKTFGRRLAENAIALIRKSKGNKPD